ncbi:MAG: lipopolysaccharide biosynthesis protein, partial [Dehalococcoidia bacterium]
MSQRPSDASFGTSVATLAGVRFIGVAAGFAVGIIGARLLDPAGFGAAGVALTIGMVAALVGNAGVNIAAIYLISRLPERRDAVIRAMSTIALVGSALAAALALLAGAVLAAPLGLPGRDALFAAAAILGVAIIGFEYGGAILLALGRRGAYTATDLVRSIGALVITAGLLAVWREDAGYVMAAALSYLVAAGIAITIGERATHALRPAWHPDLLRRGIDIGLRGQVGNVLQFLNLRLDLLLIPALLQLSAAGIYLVAVRVSEVITQVANAASSLIFPAVAAQPDRSSTELTERTVRLSLVLVIVAGLALMLIAEPLLLVAFGAAYV